jgi:integrase
MRDGAVSQVICRLARAAGVRLSMRSLRRGFGCRYAGKVPAQVLQKLMRHASIATTVTFYANVDDAAEEAVLGPQRNSSRNNQADPAVEQAEG